MPEMPKDMRSYNRAVVEEYRANGGKLSGQLANSHLLLLTTTGRKTGQLRTTPMGYAVKDDDLVVIASNVGAPAHPDWYHNLAANPDVTVELDGDRFPARATVPEGDEHRRLFDWLVGPMPYLADHQQKTTRQIPLVVLERTDNTA